MSLIKFLAVALLFGAMMAKADPLPEPEPEPEPEPALESEPEPEPALESETEAEDEEFEADAEEEAALLYERTPTCPSGWYLLSGRCFFYDSKVRTWTQAEKNCQSLGGNLASVHSAAEYHNIQWLVTTMTHKHGVAWLGASDAAEEGSWLWSDGSAFGYRYYGGFDNYNSKEHCLQMNVGENKYWNDVPCSDYYPSVCSKKPKTE